MTTHAGKGANTAFQDALHLTQHILGGDPDRSLRSQGWPESVALYEEFMWKLGQEAVKVGG
jgi:2-polyprenyl-6-methoxyphenol hydroxylase-like FAD-dependent oxidoreductase